MSTGIRLLYPVPGGRNTDRFGWRSAVYDAFGRLVVGPRLHTGRDIAAAEGTPIIAAHSGRVNRIWWDAENGVPMGGHMLRIGAARFSTRYAHLSAYAVALGDEVQAGQIIGYVGQTGAAVGSHLHFELEFPGGFVDPDPYLTASLPQLEDDMYTDADRARDTETRALLGQIAQSAVTFVATSPKGSWWATNGITRRELKPGENQLLIDLGVVKPVGKPGGVHLIDPAQLARIPVQQ